MKAKSLLLSMCAIAALASCSKNDEVTLGKVSDASEATVSLKLMGNSDPLTRVEGLPANNDLETANGTINDLTVFIFNASGTVITKQYIGNPSAPNATDISTTTDAKEVALIANTGDKTTSGGLFANVASKTALKAVVGNIIETTAVTQKDNNLYMSGLGKLSEFTKQEDGTQKATVTIQLRYLSARIQLSKITFNGKDVTNNQYVQDKDFATTKEANFTIKRVYLMNVQRASKFLPKTDGNTQIDYIDQNEKQYTGGVNWGAPWDGPNHNTPIPNQFEQNAEYTIEAAANKFAATTNTISDIGHWYVFANTGVGQITDNPTVLVVEVQWREVKEDTTTDPATAEKLTTVYFTTYFGGGDKQELEPGKVYNVLLALNGNFKPTNDGGSGGGGTEDPTKPTVNSSVDITVTSAKWNLILDINKEWK